MLDHGLERQVLDKTQSTLKFPDECKTVSDKHISVFRFHLTTLSPTEVQVQNTKELHNKNESMHEMKICHLDHSNSTDKKKRGGRGEAFRQFNITKVKGELKVTGPEG